MCRKETMTELSLKWLTVNQAAAYAQVCTATIQRWIKAGKLPASKLTAGYRIGAEQLENFMQGNNHVQN